MGIIVAILGGSGDGKTTSTIINPDGTYNPKDYQGMDPKSHFIINLDRKTLPFPGGMWSKENQNYLEVSDFATLKNALTWISKQEHIKSVAIDTINIYLAYKEFNERKKMTFDQWRDISNDIIELNELCNTVLRHDQIAYIFGHTMLQDQPDGTSKLVFSVIGKKMTRTQPEGFYTISLFTKVEYDGSGNNRHIFQTKANSSTAKTPMGMFDEFEIPNSLSLVDKTVRAYYNI